MIGLAARLTAIAFARCAGSGDDLGAYRPSLFLVAVEQGFRCRIADN